MKNDEFLIKSGYKVKSPLSEKVTYNLYLMFPGNAWLFTLKVAPAYGYDNVR